MKDTTGLFTGQLKLVINLDEAAPDFGLLWPAIKAIVERHGCLRFREDQNDAGGFSHRVARLLLRAQLRGVELPEDTRVSDRKGLLDLSRPVGGWGMFSPYAVIVIHEEWVNDYEGMVGFDGDYADSPKTILEILHRLQLAEVVR